MGVHYVAIRYSQMYYRGMFLLKEGLEVAPGVLCLIKSPRGVELGKVLSQSQAHEGEIAWLKNAKTHGERIKEDKSLLYLSGEVLRQVTEQDLEKVRERLAKGTMEEERYCKERITSHNLPMKLAGVEYLFEGEKIIFYFLAEGRVDFRDLVKDLAKKYRTRIEMKQIGVRDEARLLAEYEHCGRRLCCKGFLSNLEPVTMKMAKSQKTTLDPSKISGRCGRLMCCLRYEDHVYQELRKALPRKGAVLDLEEGAVRVLGHDVLHQKVLVVSESGVQQLLKIEELAAGKTPKPPPHAENSSNSSTPGQGHGPQKPRRPPRKHKEEKRSRR